jgi:hypothetical protein
MAFVPAPNIVEAQFRMTFGGERTMNRIHINVLTEPTEAICLSVATALAVWWTNNVDTITTNQLSLREVYVKSLHEQNGPEASYSTGFPAPGLLTADPLPNSNSIVVSLRTGLTGRSARGRWFWQGLVEAQVDHNTVQSATLTAIDGAMENLKTAITSLGYLWVVVSFFNNGGPRSGGPVYFPITAVLFTDSTVDSQRRRLPGRGQ